MYLTFAYPPSVEIKRDIVELREYGFRVDEDGLTYGTKRNASVKAPVDNLKEAAKGLSNIHGLKVHLTVTQDGQDPTVIEEKHLVRAAADNAGTYPHAAEIRKRLGL